MCSPSKYPLSLVNESAFSTSGRILDDFRTSLTPFMIEALVCTQDWLKRATPIDIAENTEELAKLEEGDSICHIFCLLFSLMKKYLIYLFLSHFRNYSRVQGKSHFGWPCCNVANSRQQKQDGHLHQHQFTAKQILTSKQKQEHRHVLLAYRLQLHDHVSIFHKVFQSYDWSFFLDISKL